MDRAQNPETPDGQMWAATALDVEGVSRPAGKHWFDGQLLGFDLETTSLDTRVSLPVQYAFVLKHAGAPLQYHSKSAIVNPEVEIPASAVAIHGITTQRCQEEGISLQQAVVGIVRRVLWAAERGIPLVGFNISYDLTIVDRLAQQHMGASLPAQGWDGPVLDVLVLDKQLDPYRKGSRKLLDMAQHYGVPFEGAHDAVADVIATLNVLLAMVPRFPELQHPAQQWWRDQIRWRRTQSESYSKYRVGKGQMPVPDHEHHWPIYVLDDGY